MDHCNINSSINEPLPDNAGLEETIRHAYHARRHITDGANRLSDRADNLYVLSRTFRAQSMLLDAEVLKIDQQLRSVWIDYLCSGATHAQWLALVQSIEAE
ncbi:MAG: hypothetical protein CTY18_03070 [Methylomonas sp.]|nr:MAG: hypothetical protein CTY18_03070 [Methylomonas sp.]